MKVIKVMTSIQVRDNSNDKQTLSAKKRKTN